MTGKQLADMLDRAAGAVEDVDANGEEIGFAEQLRSIADDVAKKKRIRHISIEVE